METEYKEPESVESESVEVEAEERETKTRDVSAFLGEAMARFDDCADASSAQRDRGLDDIRFKNGDQWDSDILSKRKIEKRPALTINRVLPTTNQVVNDGLQNKPQIKIRPIDGMSDIDTADVIGDFIRHIMNNGDSKDALDWAFDNEVSAGIGFVRVCTDYSNDKSFEQDIVIERIDNPFSVYVPYHLCKHADWSDAPYAFIREKMDKDEYEERFGKDSGSGFDKTGLGDNNWADDNGVYVAEYFIAEEDYKTIYLLSDGSTVEKLQDGQLAINTRKVCVRKVYRYLITENEILEDRKLWPSRYIPIIPFVGQEFNIDGEKIFKGIISNAKDAQNMFNYWISAFTEQVALQPKAPFIAAEGQIEGHEQEWKNANTESQSVLEFKPTSLDGTVFGAPQRVAPPAIGDAIIRGIQMSSEAIKETTGIYDAALGAKSNETSGRAIVARQRQGDTANFHFMNNFARGLRYLGRVLIDLIPNVIDTPRSIRILGEDMTEKIVRVNEYYRDENAKNGQRIYDMKAGKYDVMVTTGPSYETKRMEAADNLTNIIQAVPQIGAVASDILVRNLDFPGASELSERLKKTIPANLIEDKKQGDGAVSENELRAIITDMEALQQQATMAGQENEAMRDMIGKLQAALKDRTEERQLKMDTVVIKAQTELQKAEMQNQLMVDKAMLENVIMPNSTAPARNAETR